MQFYLPQPLHGRREFAGEVRFIVVGVLIALGAGQLIDDWKWRGTVQAERKALDRVLRSQSFRFWPLTASCIVRCRQ